MSSAAMPQCRALAAAILRDTASLGTVVEARAKRRRVRRAAALVALPIAAGAVIAVALNARDHDDAPRVQQSLPVVKQVSLTVQEGQRATLIKTQDPNVTVIWLSPGGGQ